MGMEKVEAAVLKEAKAQAQKIIDEAKRGSDDVVNAARKENESFLAEAIRLAELAAAKESNRLVGLARQEGKLAILKAKNEVIDSVFEKALSIIISLPDEEYSELIRSLLLELAPEIGGTLKISPRDKKIFTKDFLDKVNGNRQPQGKFTDVLEEDRITGGFIVEGESFSADCTFEKRFKEFREDHAGDIAKELFN